MDTDRIIAIVLGLLSVVSTSASLYFARKSKRLGAELLEPETLAAHARVGIAYAEQVGGTSAQKLLHAVGASILSDKGKNKRQDWTEQQHRIAIEAELKRSK